MIRVLLADDQHLVREGFARLLRDVDDLAVVGEASTGREAVARARETRPDVVLMDVRMPDLDGIEATTQILAEQPGIRVVAGGESILAPSVTRRLIGTFTTRREPTATEASASAGCSPSSGAGIGCRRSCSPTAPDTQRRSRSHSRSVSGTPSRAPRRAERGLSVLSFDFVRICHSPPPDKDTS